MLYPFEIVQCNGIHSMETYYTIMQRIFWESQGNISFFGKPK